MVLNQRDQNKKVCPTRNRLQKMIRRAEKRRVDQSRAKPDGK